MTKSRFLGTLFALAFLSATALAGCSSGTEADPGDKEQTSAEAKSGGTLVIVRKADANSLDPHFITNIPSANYIFGKVYEGLVKTNKEMEFQPSLATEWKQLDDVTWEFKLRQGVTFHDGTAFQAHAVKQTMERVLDKRLGSPRAAVFSMVKEVKVVDDFTVQFILNDPFAPLLSVLASNEGSILSPKAIGEQGEKLAKHPVGTGPFVFHSWTPGQEIMLVRNEKYWGAKPKVDQVVFKVVPEDATRLAMVETGEAHIGDQLPLTELERVQSSAAMSLVRTEGLGVEWIGFNVKKKPFDDVRVRQAIAYAVEKDAIISGVYNNVGSKTDSALSPKVFGFHPSLRGYDYDLNKAKQLLGEAGYPNGFKTTIITDDRKERINVAEVIQSQLKGIGVDVEVKVMEYGAYLDMTAKGRHDMFIGGWGNATGDADYNQFNVFHSSSQGDTGNHAFYANPQVDQLIEQGRKEKDLEKRKQIYAKAQEIELAEVPVIPIRTIDHVAAVSKNVQGFWLHPVSYHMIHDVTIQ